MALTGLDIYKFLPKTNCKKCGFPTCLAFAMALAGKKVQLDKCPDITETAKQALESASEPPMRTVAVGQGDNKIEIGGETVLFRHEKTFYHPSGLGITVSDNLAKGELDKKINIFNNLVFDRVGQKVKVEFIAVKNDSKDKAKFAGTVEEIKNKTKALFILLSENTDALEGALDILKDERPLIGTAGMGNYEQLANIAKKYNAALIIKGKNLDEVAQITQKVSSIGGYKDMVIDLSNDDQVSELENLVLARRLALKKNFRALGYPVIDFISGSDSFQHLNNASMAIAKYSSIVILPEAEPALFLALVTLRQNIYTDPQKPVTVEPKLYSIGGQANEKSPVLITTNFSLTYFTVEPEIINAKIPCWLLVVDTDGLSVLTAWAAEKFAPEHIVKAMQKLEVEKMVSHRKIILPGYVAMMSGKLSDLSGFEVIVGPREASGIPKFLSSMWSA